MLLTMLCSWLCSTLTLPLVKLISNKLPLICVTDNHSLFDTLKSTNLVTEKRLRLEISGVKEFQHANKIKEVLWSEAKSQLADCLTKKGASSLMLLKVLYEGVWKL